MPQLSAMHKSMLPLRPIQSRLKYVRCSCRHVGQKGRGARLKLTLNSLPAFTEDAIGQAAVQALEKQEVEEHEQTALEIPEPSSNRLSKFELAHQLAESAVQGHESLESLAGAIQMLSSEPQAEKGRLNQVSNSEPAWGSAESLARQRKTALDVLYGSNLLKNRAKPLPRPDLIQFSHLEQNRSRCPLRYDRMEYDDVKRGRYQPYLLGERAKPDCHNCDKWDNLWSRFCQFQTHGPVCPGWLKWQLASDWVKRAENGSPGVKELLMLTPCDLFSYIKDRTLWLIGDSLTLEWDKAVQCFLYEFWDLELVHLNDTRAKPNPNFQGWCAHMAQGAKVCFLRGNTGEELANDILPSLKHFGASTSDVMVINFAVWSNSKGDYRRNISRFAEYYKANQGALPITIWRDAPVQHFDTHSGDYVWPVPSDECKAVPQIELMQDNSLKALHPSAQVVAEGGWRNRIALPVIKKLGITIMHTWNQSLPMWQYHTHFSEHGGDCTHMCHPSEYQYWVFELYQTLKFLFPNV